MKLTPQLIVRPLTLLVIAISAIGCAQVDAGNLGVVTKWGEIQAQPLQEGIHLKMPIQTDIINISTRVHKLEAAATASSKDLQVVGTTIALNYRVNAKQVVELFRNVGTLEDASSTIIEPALQEAVKRATAQYTAEQLVTARQDVKLAITTAIEATLQRSHIVVTEVAITDFQFDTNYQNAVEAKQVAEQHALTARNDLARIKVEAEQELARAQGVANARLAQAESEAKAQELLRRTITPEIVYLRAIERWDGVQPSVVGEGAAILDLGEIKRAATKH